MSGVDIGSGPAAQNRLPLEERKGRIRSMEVARTKSRLWTRRPEAGSLRVGLEVTRSVSAADLRTLAGVRYEQPVVSVYLNAAPQGVVGRPRVHLTVFNSMRRREVAARSEMIDGLSGPQRQVLFADLDEVEEVLGTLDLTGSRSVVIFKSGRALNRVMLLPVRTTDALAIDTDPYVHPLEAALEAHPPCLVVEVSKRESRFWIQSLGGLAHVTSVEAFTPSDSVDRGRPAKAQRHRLTHLEWHLKMTAHVAGRLVTEQSLDQLILCGEQRVLAKLDRFLPDALRTRVIGRLHLSPHGERGEWRQQVERALMGWRRRQEEAALARLSDYQAGGVLVGGLAAVVEVANRFVVRKLFVSVHLEEPGWVCRQHHFLSLQGGCCPFCGAGLSPTGNVVDELVEFASLQGVELMVVQQRPDLLDPHDGVAAVTYELF